MRALTALIDDDGDGAAQLYTRIKLPSGHPLYSDEVRYDLTTRSF